MPKNLLSPTEVALMLGISRTHVWRKIQSGEIKAEKVGNRYIVPASQFKELRLSEPVSESEISKAVKRVVKEYGTTLKKLGAE